mmetsp:Transcript_19157/g.23572  ORF Transcript_19157/g.23572 Transcript_19157/m.23572 type:complete len:223 (-) Transcript_19157:772-1440(-)
MRILVIIVVWSMAMAMAMMSIHQRIMQWWYQVIINRKKFMTFIWIRLMNVREKINLDPSIQVSIQVEQGQDQGQDQGHKQGHKQGQNQIIVVDSSMHQVHIQEKINQVVFIQVLDQNQIEVVLVDQVYHIRSIYQPRHHPQKENMMQIIIIGKTVVVQVLYAMMREKNSSLHHIMKSLQLHVKENKKLLRRRRSKRHPLVHHLYQMLIQTFYHSLVKREFLQ